MHHSWSYLGSVASLVQYQLRACRRKQKPVCPKFLLSWQVAVGSYSDPDDIPGLAHFLEHMLFFGSEKYPEENGYGKFIQVRWRVARLRM